MSHTSQKLRPDQTISRSQAVAPTQPSLIYLYEIDIDATTTHRFINDLSQHSHVRFAGHRYDAFPIVASGFAWSADGPPARPQLQLSNIRLTYQNEIIADRLRGNQVRRIMTLASELEPPHGNGNGNCFPLETWIIDRIGRLDDSTLRLELTAEASFEGRRLPERLMLRDLCQHSYRRWVPSKTSGRHGRRFKGRFDYSHATCPYVDENIFFTIQGYKTNNPAKDHCSLALRTGCKKRFPHGALPFLGFPGVRRK